MWETRRANPHARPSRWGPLCEADAAWDESNGRAPGILLEVADLRVCVYCMADWLFTESCSCGRAAKRSGLEGESEGTSMTYTDWLCYGCDIAVLLTLFLLFI